MSVERNIHTILTTHGTVRARGDVHLRAGTGRVTEDVHKRVEDLSWNAVCTINVAGNSIDVHKVAGGTVGINGVYIGNQAETAAVGLLPATANTGFLYSDFFSGCAFFLFRSAAGIYGVHSFRVSGTYANPVPYMAQRNATLLYAFDSRNVFTNLGRDIFGTVICYVTPNKIVIKFFAMETDGSVHSLVDDVRINAWGNKQLFDPNYDGAMADWREPVPRAAVPQPVQPPGQVGLMKRVENFFIKYI